MRRMVLFDATEQRAGVLVGVSSHVQISMAELLRRMIDHCSRQSVLDEMFPACSGSFTLRVVDGERR